MKKEEIKKFLKKYLHTILYTALTTLVIIFMATTAVTGYVAYRYKNQVAYLMEENKAYKSCFNQINSGEYEYELNQIGNEIQLVIDCE